VRTGAPDPAALRSPALVRFFGRVMGRSMARAFRAVRVARPGVPELPPGRPAIVYANHPSWWDPALFILLGTRCWPERQGFGPIEASQLKRYPFFRRIGLFGVEPGDARAGVGFLATAQRLLSSPGRMLWITAQGAFTDPRVRPVAIRGGLPHLAARLPDAVLVPLAVEYPFWTESRPEALCRFGPLIDAGTTGPLSPAAWQALLEERLARTMDALAADAVARDAGAFTTLVEGTAGVGGVYDLWRRARAWAGGRSFEAAHGDGPGDRREVPR